MDVVKTVSTNELMVLFISAVEEQSNHRHVKNVFQSVVIDPPTLVNYMTDLQIYRIYMVDDVFFWCPNLYINARACQTSPTWQLFSQQPEGSAQPSFISVFTHPSEF